MDGATDRPNRPNVPAHEKFELEDAWYLEMRQGLLTPDQWDLVENAPLYQGSQHIARRLAVYEILKQTLMLPGDILEFGTWHGANLLWMAKCLQVLTPQTYKHVWGFDTFEGLQTFADQDDGGPVVEEAYRGTYVGDAARLEHVIEQQRMHPWVHLVKGDVAETAERFFEEHPHVVVSLAYLDADLYKPTIAALDALSGRLVSGGIIVFDEAGHPSWPGEMRAMLSRLTGAHFKMRTIPFARQPMLIAVAP